MGVRWSTTYSLSGSGEQFGQPFTIEGAGQTRGRHLLEASGRYLGTVSTDSSVSTVTLTNLGIEVPVIQIARDTVRLLK